VTTIAAPGNLFEIVQEHLGSCSIDMHIDKNVEALLATPRHELHVAIPVRMDTGEIKTFQGFRIQYNAARGPTKGGIRFHPEETADTIRGLAALMSLKCALHNLPLGGAKGGVICNTKELSKGELERLSRAYIASVSSFIGPMTDIGAPDMYTNPEIMGWMADEYAKITGRPTPGIVTGKPLSIGGSEGRMDATARGGWIAIREAAAETSLNLKGAHVVIQGFGNAGSNAALLGAELFGCQTIAVSDSRTAIVNPEGLAIQELIQYKKETGSVAGFPDATEIESDQLMSLETDILIPTALENVITKKNAASIQASIIAELANGPTTKEADKILREKGTHVIPDLLCNGGGVVVSYFEMVQNFNMDHWPVDEVHKRLDSIISGSYHEVLSMAKQQNTTMRNGAYLIAIGRIIEAMQSRGWI